MATTSTETGQETPAKSANSTTIASVDEKNFRVFLLLIIKKAILINVIYFVGYLNWSVTWLLTPMILLETRNYWGSSTSIKRAITKKSTKGREKDVILTRIKDLPSWVYFPDFERCEWMNCILARIWPMSNEFTKNLIKNVLEPKIRKALSKSKLKLSGFEFDHNRILLGTTPPRIGGIKLYDKHISRDEIILDMDLIFASDCSIKFRLAKMSAALKNFEIYGRVRVIMKPLISKVPFIGGLQIFFLDKPEIDFNLGGATDLISMPALSDILRHIILKKISKLMVSPNKIAVPLSKKIPPTVLKMPEPEGVLRINVIEARDLIIRDYDGSSDPYAVINIGAQQFQTRKVYSNLNPTWNFTCEACIDVKFSRKIEFSLYDWDLASRREPLGRTSIEISSIIKNGAMDMWLPLEGVEHGQLHVSFIWFELSSKFGDLAAALAEARLLSGTNLSSAILCVYLDSASDLPETDVQSDPFVILNVGNCERLSSAKKQTDAPVWEQGFTFMVANPEHDILKVRVVGKKSNRKDVIELGHFTYAISELLTQNDLQIILKSFSLRNSDPTSKVTLSLALKFLKRTKSLSNGIHSMTEATVEKSISDTPSESLGGISEPEVTKSEATTVNAHDDNTTTTTTSDDNESLQLPEKTHFSVASYGLARIQITLFYSTKCEELQVTVIQIMNIPMDDSSNVPSPYVKIILKQQRSKRTKRKTHSIKNSCDPIYNKRFEFDISSDKLKTSELDVIVKTKESMLSKKLIGMVKIDLKTEDIIDKELTNFYDLSQGIPNNE